MVGICGTLGEDATSPDEMTEWITWHADETTFSYADERVELTLSGHPTLTDEQPVSVDAGDVLVWVWGDVYGHGTGGDYAPRTGPPDGSADFCARLYRERGLSFVSELNGDFALVIHDRAANTLAFVTDRVATRPIYYARPSDDSFVFASNLQALPHHPDVSPAFDLPYLYEYLKLRRVFGVETPLTGVRELPPASVVEVDLDDLATRRTTYWRPQYDPIDEPPSYFVDRITDTCRQIFSEWTRDDLDYGLLLSGGSDSRFVRACMDRPAVAFHNTDWISRETRVARRIAETAGDEFRLLLRDPDHEARTLDAASALSSFSGWFDQAYFTEFESEIRDEVDVLVSGMFADMLFGDGALATQRQSLGSLGTLSLPVKRPVDDVDDYIDVRTTETRPLPYFSPDLSLRDVLSDNIRRTPDGVVSHGVRYDSLRDLELYGDYYPLGADTEAIFSRSLMQIRPYRTPFLDNRLLDIQQRVPMEYLLRRDLIDAGVRTADPDLAEIPHATTGVPVKYPPSVKYVGENLIGFFRKHVHEPTPPAPHLDHGPWPNRDELLRTRSFGVDTIRRNADLLRDLPFLDYEGAERTFESHMDGEPNHTALYSLLTMLELPVTETVARAAAESGAVAVDVSPGDAWASTRDPESDGSRSA